MRETREGVHVKSWSFWSDPIWSGMRIISFLSASATVILLAIFLSGVRGSRIPLEAAVVTNVGIMVALAIRTSVLRAKVRHSPKP
jgi:hypothetical protein